jgi:hypothetical protein
MSKARDIANILSANTAIATDAEVTAAISAATSGLATSSSVSTAVTNERSASATLTNKVIDGNSNTIHVKRGTTAERPVTTTIGDQYFDTTVGALYNYSVSGWVKVSQDPPPQIASISPTTAANTGTLITITGSGYSSGLSVQFIGTNSVSYNSPVATFVNATTATATTPNLPVAYEPYDVKIINSDNQFAVLENCLDAGGTPTWNTPSGLLTTVTESSAVSTSVSATDPDGTSIIYSSTNLPAWLSINSSSGAITGTAPSVSLNTTYSFDITASDGLNTSSRSFSIAVIDSLSIQYLVIAGGGAGGTADDGGAGGGAGGYRCSVPGENSGRLSTAESPYLTSAGSQISVVVGQGGSGVRGSGYNDNGGLGVGKGNPGSNSQFGTIISIGGGGGGGVVAGGGMSGGNGGSGGGAGQRDGYGAVAGTGTAGQGFDGGSLAGGTNDAGGGGGGAGSAGGNTNGNTGGNGGSGISSSITGSSVTRAGGGAGGGYTANGSAGSGGGGAAGAQTSGGGSSGATNTGSGGGASNVHASYSGSGGSGIVIIRYVDTAPDISSIPGTLSYTRTVTGGYKIYQFTAGSGTITI